MCGFGITTLFEVAIFIVVICVLIAMINWAFPNAFGIVGAAPFGGLIRILIGGVVAIIIILILWKFVECAGLLTRIGYNTGGMEQYVKI